MIEADLAAHLGGLGGTADLVLSNPPYVTTAEMETLPPEVAGHDPRAALCGGADGLETIRALVPAAAAALRPGGLLLLEASDATATGAADLIERCGEYDGPEVEKDLAGRLRVVSARRAGGPPAKEEGER